MQNDSRSPLKDPPLRTAGQSLREERDRVFEDEIELPFLQAFLVVAVSVIEWFRYVWEPPNLRWLYTVFAIGAVTFAAWRWKRYMPIIRNLREGFEGEIAVGQLLDLEQERGFRVFHDVLAPGFNIDHVLIGPRGVYTVETKTRSKPLRGDARIRFEDDRLIVGMHEPDRDYIAQARAQAAWMRNFLRETCGLDVAVRAVLVFPGWYVEPRPAALKDVWVLEPKALASFIARENESLSTDEVRSAAFMLSKSIRLEQRRGSAATPYWSRRTRDESRMIP